ncbi:Thioredoxin-interacting protein, partial [Acanthisitta chloris]
FPLIPTAPPCYLDIVPEDHRLESPTTPLLDDPDGFDSPIFMYAPEFKFMPPPTYTEAQDGPGNSGNSFPDPSPNSQVDPCVANNNVQ